MRKETSKGDVESIFPKVTKHASKKMAKAEANLNWLAMDNLSDYELFCFIAIYIHERI